MSIVFRNNISSKLKNTTSESATILIQTGTQHRKTKKERKKERKCLLS